MSSNYPLKAEPSEYPSVTRELVAQVRQTFLSVRFLFSAVSAPLRFILFSFGDACRMFEHC